MAFAYSHDMNNPVPIFLISLPRSGSTLLQRILMTHEDVASRSEPWLLLPQIYMLKAHGMVTEYSHRDAALATEEFIEALPGKKAEYYGALRKFIIELFSGHCHNSERYFIDKTPRYYLIIDELAAIFPEAKFIFLVRNPIQIISSLITSFSNKNLKNLHFYHIDLLQGFGKMAEGIRRHQHRSIVVNYEQLVSDPQKMCSQLFNFLNLEWNSENLNQFSKVNLTGSLGDKSGVNEYTEVDARSIEKWKSVFRENVRKKYLRALISGMSESVLSDYGYPKDAILNQIDELQTKVTLRGLVDMKDIFMSTLIKTFYLNLYRKKVKDWSKDIVIS